MKRWEVVWTAKVLLYGHALVAGTPHRVRTWTRRGAERVKERMEAAGMTQEGTIGEWVVRRAERW